MLLKHQEFYDSLTALSPGLVERIRKVVEESERKFSGKSDGRNGFLWEHTVLVASMAFRLACVEKEDPALASLVALFHDAGKFSGGRYHNGEKPEEEAASRLARSALEESGLPMAAVGHVVRALRSLYLSGARRNRLADIVHDADFLSKSGYLGVANFFVKSALRGRNLEAAVMDFLGRELTYAAVLPQNMRTQAARRLAGRKSADTLRFYKAFLAELRETHNMDFRVRTAAVARRGGRGRRVKVSYAAPVSCGLCGGKWEVSVRTEKGLKCEKVEVSLRCGACAQGHTLSFCLPEMG